MPIQANMNNYTYIYKAFLLVSAISFFLSFFFNGLTYYNSMLSGYIAFLIAGIMVILTMMSTSNNDGQDKNGILEVFFMNLPVLILIGIICFIISLITKYKTIIIDSHVPYSYITYSNIAIIVVMYQIYNLYNTNTVNPNLSFFQTLLSSMIILACYVKIYIILKYFITDGFTVIP